MRLTVSEEEAVRTMGKLEDNKSLYEEFADIIDKAVMMLMPQCVTPCIIGFGGRYIILTDSGQKKEYYIYWKRIIQTLSFYGTKNVLFYLYPKYKERVIDIISKAYASDDKKLTDTASYMVCEFYIIYGEFADIMSTPTDKNEEQSKGYIRYGNVS